MTPLPLTDGLRRLDSQMHIITIENKRISREQYDSKVWQTV